MTPSRYPEHVIQEYHAYTQGQLTLQNTTPFKKKTVATKLLENLANMHNIGFYKSYAPDNKPYRPELIIIATTPHEPFAKQHNNNLSAFYIDLAHHYPNLTFFATREHNTHSSERRTYLDGLTPDTLETITDQHPLHYITKPTIEQNIQHWQKKFDHLLATKARNALKLSCREQLAAQLQQQDNHTFAHIKKYLDNNHTTLTILTHHFRRTLHHFLTQLAEENKTAYTIMLVKR